MTAFLDPAILLMDRLRYPRKFVLLSLLFIIPLALVTILLATNILVDKEFSQRERMGTAYLRPLVGLFDQLLEQQIASEQPENATPKNENKLAEIDRSFKALRVIDARFGNSLATTKLLDSVETEWRGIQASANEAGQQTAKYRSLINKTRQLIAQVGDTSNLILDPQIDCYYVMDTVLLKLPESYEHVAQIRLFGGRMVEDQSLDQRVESISLVGKFEADVDANRLGLDKVRQTNPAVYAGLANAAQIYFEHAALLLQQTRSSLIRSTAQADSVELALQTQQAGRVLWAQSIDALDGLLQARIDWYNQQLALAASVIIAGLGLALYFCSGMYHSMIRTIATLDTAAQRMVRGDSTAAVQLRSHDELGEVVRVFNQVAAALVAASAQRQAVVEHAADGIITVDDSGNISSLNPAAQTMFGYNAEQTIGEPIALLLPEYTLQPQASAQHVLDGHRANGTLFACELTVSQLRGSGTSGVIVIIRDISELRRVEAERAQLQAAIIHAQATALDELSTPLIPISDHVLVMPLIGAIDSRRANQVIETLLRGIEQSRARTVILDITGVPVVDTLVAAALIRSAHSVRLLGAKLVLTGVRPEIAQTIIGLGLDLSMITTSDTLQHGIAHAVDNEIH